MKNLSKILRGVKTLDIQGDSHIDISKIIFDSRKAEKDCLFVAVKGTQVDGHTYISQVIEKGATAIICEEIPQKMEGVTYIKVDNSALVLGQIAANFYDIPSKKLKLVGVTGTNGKTTTATLLYDLFTGLGFKCGLISTVE
jgi:UDP-N-acetylmuramoyl-L-alanyl-D-glutamate--2,6-diaminopimelate ligase